MKNLLQERLNELNEEYSSGQQMLLEIENKRQELRERILRISGAIQILQEVLEENNPTDIKGVVTVPASHNRDAAAGA